MIPSHAPFSPENTAPGDTPALEQQMPQHLLPAGENGRDTTSIPDEPGSVPHPPTSEVPPERTKGTQNKGKKKTSVGRGLPPRLPQPAAESRNPSEARKRRRAADDVDAGRQDPPVATHVQVPTGQSFSQTVNNGPELPPDLEADISTFVDVNALAPSPDQRARATAPPSPAAGPTRWNDPDPDISAFWTMPESAFARDLPTVTSPESVAQGDVRGDSLPGFRPASSLLRHHSTPDGPTEPTFSPNSSALHAWDHLSQGSPGNDAVNTAALADHVGRTLHTAPLLQRAPSPDDPTEGMYADPPLPPLETTIAPAALHPSRDVDGDVDMLANMREAGPPGTGDGAVRSSARSGPAPIHVEHSTATLPGTPQGGNGAPSSLRMGDSISPATFARAVASSTSLSLESSSRTATTSYAAPAPSPFAPGPQYAAHRTQQNAQYEVGPARHPPQSTATPAAAPSTQVTPVAPIAPATQPAQPGLADLATMGATTRPEGGWPETQGLNTTSDHRHQLFSQQQAWRGPNGALGLVHFAAHGAQDSGMDQLISALSSITENIFQAPFNFTTAVPSQGAPHGQNIQPYYLAVSRADSAMTQTEAMNAFDAIAAMGWISTREVTFRFERLRYTPPTFLGALRFPRRFGSVNPNDITQRVATRIQEDSRTEPTLRNLIERDVLAQGMWRNSDQTAVLHHVLRSVRADTIPFYVNGEVSETIVRIYMDPPTAGEYEWDAFRHFILNIPFGDDMSGNPERLYEELHCRICHSFDHQTEACPLPRTPGWNGPNSSSQNAAPPSRSRRPTNRASSFASSSGSGNHGGRGGGTGGGRGRRGGSSNAGAGKGRAF